MGGWGAGTYGFGYKRLRTSRLHSPPTSVGADPLQHHHQMLLWQIQLANYIIHLDEAESLLDKNGKKYILERSIGELHPMAMEELHSNKVLSQNVENLEIPLVTIIEKHIDDDAGIKSHPEMYQGQTVPDRHDPHGVRMVYTLPSGVKVHLWEPVGQAFPPNQGWRLDNQGWTLVEVRVFEVSIPNAQKMLVNLRSAERMQQFGREVGGRIWNQMTQARLPQFQSTQFFGGTH
jgi:hypothetical protein